MGRSKKPPMTAPSDRRVSVRLFGLVELENRWGRAAENTTRPSYSWLLLKYLLVDPGREVPLEELSEHIWTDDGDINLQYAANIRLRRLREALAPLGLDGRKGLVLHHDGLYGLNPDYELETDEEIFWRLMKRIRSAPAEDPVGLELCARALELYRGRFMEYTGEAPWLSKFRAHYHQEFCELARTTLERARVLGDGRYMALLSLRAAAIAPREEELHRALAQYLNGHGREIELVRYRAQLTRHGGLKEGDPVGSI